MKIIFALMFLMSGLVHAQDMTVRIDGKDYAVNPATGFLVKATPKDIAHIQPTDQVSEYGPGITVTSSTVYGSRAPTSGVVITNSGMYSVSRAGSTTYIIGNTSRSK